jgi:hypothetical protein
MNRLNIQKQQLGCHTKKNNLGAIKKNDNLARKKITLMAVTS